MNIWDPFHPVAYFLHSILGVAGILGAIAALALTKGSRRHILAGRAFAIAAAVAAGTAIVFSFTTFAPMSIASAVMTFSAIGSAFLALRRKTTSVTTGEIVTAALMILSMFWLLFGVAISIPQGGFLWIPPLIFAFFPAALFVNDIRFIRKHAQAREEKRIRRHFSRMAFALAVAVHAPVVTFADDFNIHPALAFYGPFILWPAIVLAFNRKPLVLPN